MATYFFYIFYELRKLFGVQQKNIEPIPECVFFVPENFQCEYLENGLRYQKTKK